MVKNKRNRKSKTWANRQDRDYFVKLARHQGLRARSVFKLDQIDNKYRLVRPQSKVVDLGSAPGSWSQYVASKVAGTRQIVAIDLLTMDPIEKVEFIQGDFTDLQTQSRIMKFFGGEKIDLVLSDMAPNISGIRITDQANFEILQEAILGLSVKSLKTGGKLMTKLFSGDSLDMIRNRFDAHFDSVQMVKPAASRVESREVYLLAHGFKSSRLE